MVSNASEDLPEPDRPVMTTSESRGSSTVTSLRLCSRAPETTMEFWREDIRPLSSLRSERTEKANGCSLRARNSDRRGQQPGIQQLGLEVGEERFYPELLPRHPLQQLARSELAAVAVDVVAQPLAQRREVAGGDAVLDRRQLLRERA